MKSLGTAIYFASTIMLYPSPYVPSKVGTAPNNNDIAVYAYDHAGNRIAKSVATQQQIIHQGLGRDWLISNEDGSSETIKKGPGGGRYLRIRKNQSGATERTTLYVGNLKYHLTPNGVTSQVEIRHGPTAPIAEIELNNGNPNYRYHLHDHLGSSLLIVNEGNVLARNRYTPSGQPVKADGVASDFNETDQRFTGHNNIASSRLIDMQARLYDPQVDLFLAPDIFKQDVSLGVGLNRYSYVAHRYLNETDPTGWARSEAPILGRSLKPSERRVLHAFWMKHALDHLYLDQSDNASLRLLTASRQDKANEVYESLNRKVLEEVFSKLLKEQRAYQGGPVEVEHSGHDTLNHLNDPLDRSRLNLPYIFASSHPINFGTGRLHMGDIINLAEDFDDPDYHLLKSELSALEQSVPMDASNRAMIEFNPRRLPYVSHSMRPKVGKGGFVLSPNSYSLMYMGKSRGPMQFRVLEKPRPYETVSQQRIHEDFFLSNY